MVNFKCPAETICVRVRSGGSNNSLIKRSGSLLKYPLGFLFLILLLVPETVAGLPHSPQTLLPWLDIPAGWSAVVNDNVISLVPGDLPSGSVLLFMIEKPSPHKLSLDSAYQNALADLGPWRPVGNPIDQPANNGWRFRFGVGVTQLKGVSYTALTAVAMRTGLMARFWVLADSDKTYNRYQGAVLTAVSSVQDIPRGSVSGKQEGPPFDGVKTQKPGKAFGIGVSGVYMGIVRSVRTGAAAGTYIDDYQEIDVFFPDHTYRRRLPLRGLNSDPAWDRRQQSPLWGTWQQQGNTITVRRGNYTSRYTLQGSQLIDDRGRNWIKVVPPGAKRIDGIFARADYRDATAPRLMFRGDGTYEERGDFLRMVTSSWHMVKPDGNTMLARLNEADYRKLQRAGSGTYSFENFTLTLNAADGRIWQVNTFVPSSENFPYIKQMVINGYKLQRD